MKFDEIFSRAEFPLRAKTTVTIAPKGLKVQEFIYYQRPYLLLHMSGDPINGSLFSQSYGLCRKLYSGKKIVCIFGMTYTEKSGNKFFTVNSSEWIEISRRELSKITDIFLEMAGPDFCGGQCLSFLNARWKSF